MDSLCWQKATKSIIDVILQCEWYRECADLYCYVDFRQEVGTATLMQDAWRLGKRVWVPKVIGTELSFYAIHSAAELSPGTFGVMEPKGDTKAGAGEGLMIVPGVAFDRNRNRIGYGKGFYDRYLKSHPGLRTIAVAFDLQILDEVPSEPQDVRPDILLTESRLLPEEKKKLLIG